MRDDVKLQHTAGWTHMLVCFSACWGHTMRRGIHKEEAAPQGRNQPRQGVIKLKMHGHCKVYEGFLHWKQLQDIITHYMCQPNPPGCSHLGHLDIIYLARYSLWHRGRSYSRGCHRWSSSACVVAITLIFPSSNIWKDLSGESPVRLLKASHMSTGNVLHEGVYFKYLSRDKSSHLTGSRKVCLHDSWPSGPHNPAQWLPEVRTLRTLQERFTPADACPARFPLISQPLRSTDFNALFKCWFCRKRLPPNP